MSHRRAGEVRRLAPQHRAEDVPDEAEVVVERFTQDAKTSSPRQPRCRAVSCSDAARFACVITAARGSPVDPEVSCRNAVPPGIRRNEKNGGRSRCREVPHRHERDARAGLELPGLSLRTNRERRPHQIEAADHRVAGQVRVQDHRRGTEELRGIDRADAVEARRQRHGAAVGPAHPACAQRAGEAARVLEQAADGDRVAVRRCTRADPAGRAPGR